MLQKLAGLIPHPVGIRLRAWRAVQRGHNPELYLLKHLHSGGMFVDVGANIGDYSRVACLVFGRVFAVEPIPALAAKLKRELSANATVLELALSDAPGTATLFIPHERGTTVTGLASLDRAANGAAQCQEIEVAVRTLDSLMLRGIDVIKIDVEGLEERVLRGAMKTLRRERPAMIVEIEDRHHMGGTDRIFGLLDDIGYDCFYLQGHTLVPVALPHPAGHVFNRAANGRYLNKFVFLHASRAYPSLAALRSVPVA